MAFPIPFGLYQFTMIPFGLHGAAATFQRLMNQILGPHNSYATAYLNNFVIYSASWKEHLQHLASMLQALGNTGLTANLAKCHLGQREVTYLGYTMGREKLCLLVDKVQALRDYPTPTMKRKVPQFLGLAGYFGRFVANFAMLTIPLTDLTKSSQPWKVQWSKYCEAAFQAL
ncbi:unnamed protein product [Natator depressus]